MNFDNLVGQSLGKYQLIELLGVGGMGAVFKGYDPDLKREVAIKVLNASLASDPNFLMRFTHEATTVAKLEHPHIVPIYDSGTDKGISYVVMRLLTGGSLEERLAQRLDDNLPLPTPHEVLDLLRQLASALDYAHSQGVVHRDIKPSNIMFDNRGSAFIVDFGIAKLVNMTSGLTETGVAMGTPSYMPPEQWRGQGISPQSDQYALAAVIYALLAGRPPFQAETAYALMHKHLTEMPTPVHEIRVGLPRAITEVLNKAMAKDPKARFATLKDFVNAFESAIGNIINPVSTGFLTFTVRKKPHSSPLIQRQFPQRQSTPYPPPYMPSAKRAYSPNMSAQRRNSMPFIVGGVGILAILALILVVIVGRGNHGGDTGANVTNIANAIVLLNTDTPVAASSETPSMPTTNISIVTATNAPASTHTSPLSQTERAQTQEVIIKATLNAMNTQTEQARFVENTIAALIQSTSVAQSLTETANAPTPTHTATPSDTFTPTFTLTATSTFTDTPTPTNTPTFTPTATQTPLPSLTPTDTILPPTHYVTNTPTAAPAGYLGGAYITHNNQWRAVIQNFDGVPMAFVPIGCFNMGITDDQIAYAISSLGVDAQGVADEQPVRLICFDAPFWVDVTEVTNAQFNRLRGVAGRSSQWTDDNLPRVNITWYEARDYCRQRGGRLPTEAEWEYVARGPSNYLFPWGDFFEDDRMAYHENSDNQPQPVNSYPLGASWVGAIDMAGNVWEWISTIDMPYPYSATDGRENMNIIADRGMRGGDWSSRAHFARSTNRNWYAQDGQFNNVGFRCVRDYQG